MTGHLGRSAQRNTLPLLLWLVATGCTRDNPAFEPGDAGAEEVARDAAAERGPPRPDALPADAVTTAIDSAGADTVAAVNATGLVGYWPLDDGTGSAQAGDRSGNGNAGSLAMVDATSGWKAGHAGSALEIPDTVGAGVMVKPSASLDGIRTGLTISAWVYRLTSIKERNLTVLSRQVGTASREVYSLAFQNDVMVIWLYAASPASEVNLRATRTAPLNAWIHVATTWDGKTVRLYQDGAEVGLLSYAGPMGASDKPVILGNNANSTGLDQPLGGRLDEVRLYDRALSAAEIAALAK
jgi:hypothetical protein